MKHWKKQGKRGLSLFLSMVMCLSMVNLTAFATENGLTKGIVADGAFVADSTNKTLGETFTNGASNTVSTPGGKVQVTKSAEPVASPDGNVFDVTLQVVTQGEEIKEVESPDAAVTLVIDISSSMYHNNSGDVTRLKAAQEAAKTFVDNFVSGANGARRMVSLVAFWGGGEIQTSWVDAATADGLQKVKDAIDALPADKTGTNIQAGLQLAMNLYDQRNSWAKPVDGIQNRFSVLLTDGEPYDRIVDPVNGTETSYSSDGNNTKNDGTNTKYPTEAAQKLLNANIQSYAICFASKVQSWMKTADTTTTTEEKTVVIEWEFDDGKWEIDKYKKAEDWKPGNREVGNWTIEIDGVKYDAKYYYKDKDEIITKHTVPGQTITTPKTFDMAVEAKDANDLNQQFDTITNLIKLAVEAWTVTDPMAEGVKFEKFVGEQGSAKAEGNLITWDLKNEKTNVKTETAGDTTTVTYTLKYRVTVDATGEHYDETVVHPLNKYTELKYMFLKNDQRVDEYGNPYQGNSDQLDTVGFNVPGVTVERPVRPWRIEYYKQENATAGDYESYTQVTDDTQTGEGKVQSKVELADKDPEWETKYDNYTCMSRNEIITIQADSENVIKVYYDRKTTSATVNYHYTLKTIDEIGEYETNYDVNGAAVNGLFVGEEYSADAPETSTYGGYTYNFDHATPNGGKISKLDQDGDKNVIDLYYVKEIDYRRDASVVVNHVYTLHTYELEDGKYVEKDVVVEVSNAEVVESGLKAGETYTANTTPRVGFNDYQYEGVSGWDNVVTLHDGKNVITLNFENWEDPRGEELSLTVKHHYTKSVTEIVDGNVVTTVDPDNEVVEETVKFYAGETVTVNKQRVYNSDTYEIGGDSDTVVLPNPMNGAEYNLFYTLVKEPQKTTVTVEHIYQTVTHETVTTYEDVEKVIETETTDPETGETVKTTETVIEKVPTGTETVDHVQVDKTVTDDPVDVFVGQRYQATLKGENGYTYHSSTPDDYTIDACVEGGNEITIVYRKDANADNRKEATIDVQHVYTTHVKAVIGGEVKEFDTFFTVAEDTHNGKAGDTFTANAKPTYGGVTYTQIADESDTVEKVLHEGTNSTIIFHYERSDDQLGEQVGYTVNYEYYTRTMTVVDGVAVWGEPVKDETVSNEAVNGTGYAGQKVELDTGAMSGYNAMEGNPSSIQFLKAEGNEWTFKHVKDVPLDKVPVTVNHHVTIKTLTVDSESSATQDLMGRPEYKYAGESYEAKALDIGTLTLVNVNGSDVETQKVVTFDALSGIVVVDFYYEIVNDLRTPAAYTVQHIYKTIDENDVVTIDNPDAKPITKETYAFMPGTAAISLPENAGYQLVEATYNGSAVNVDGNGVYSFTVQAGENAVVFVYERHVDTRDPVHATVFHEYYSSASATEPAYRDSVVTYDLRPGDSFTATEIFEKNGVTYQLAPNSDPLTITLDEDSQQNTITIRYVLAETTYKVVHTYYTNGSLTGSTDPVTVGGNVGDVVTADSVAKVLTYGGNSYSYTSSSGEFTLVQGENGTITLRYDRTTGGGGGGNNNNNDDDDDDDNGGGTPTPPVVDVPDEQPPLIEEPVIDIPDEQPPKEEAPEEEILEEEILEEEVPLSDVPQTGDNSKPVFWAVLGALSFLGIVLLGRKRKDEEA